MKKLFILMPLILLGCVVQPRTPATRAASASQDLVRQLLAITQQDLVTTIQIANAIPPPYGPDMAQIRCAAFLQSFLPSLQAAGPPGFIPPTGAISAFETLRAGIMIAEGAAPGGLSTQQQNQLDQACGALAVSTARQVASGAIDITSFNGNSYIQMLLSLARAGLWGY